MQHMRTEYSLMPLHYGAFDLVFCQSTSQLHVFITVLLWRRSTVTSAASSSESIQYIQDNHFIIPALSVEPKIEKAKIC